VKKQAAYHLLAIVGVVLLMGLVASCGGNDEPQFKTIETMEYKGEQQGTNWALTRDTLWSKYWPGKNSLESALAQQIHTQYRNDIVPLMREKLLEKNPAAGLFMVIKVDKYKMLCFTYWLDNKGQWTYSFWMFDN
jgi:hypothetical protein